MKPKVIILQGLPASGKSTWAKEFCEKHNNFIRVNKDDIRAMMASEFSKPREEIVLCMRDQAIVAAVEKGFGIIIDDTNFEQKHIDRINELVKHRKVEVEVKFFDVPASECLKRNASRANPVPADVITSMAERYNVGKEIPEFEPIVQDSILPEAVIVDIDGTLARMGDRSPFEWSKVGLDTYHEDILQLVDILREKYFIIFVSGRSDECVTETMDWLKNRFPPYSIHLIMRKAGDNRKDSYIKYEILEKLSEEYYIKYILDDRDQVVKMAREAGFRVLQVANGNF